MLRRKCIALNVCIRRRALRAIISTSMNLESKEQTRSIVNKKKEIKIRVEVNEIETEKISKTKS